MGYVDIDRKGLSGVERFYNSELIREEQPLQVAADHRIQDILYHQLQEGRKKYKAKFASGVIMNVNNGEVVALASLPSFDPNTQSNASAAQKFNRVTNGVYELGSIFKIFTNAIAFEEVLDVLVNTFGRLWGDFTISDGKIWIFLLSFLKTEVFV